MLHGVSFNWWQGLSRTHTNSGKKISCAVKYKRRKWKKIGCDQENTQHREDNACMVNDFTHEADDLQGNLAMVTLQRSIAYRFMHRIHIAICLLFYFGCQIQDVNGQFDIGYIHPKNGLNEFGEICFVTAEIGYAVGGSLYKTVDGGKSWTSSGDEFGFAKLSFVSETVGYLLTNNGKVYKTSDGGNSFQLKLSVSVSNHTPAFIQFFNETGYVRFAYGNSSTFKTIDGGETWQEKPFPIEVLTPWGYAFYALNETIFFAGQSMKLRKSVDSGETWTEIATLPHPIGTIQFINEDLGFIYDHANRISKTTNGGISWTTITLRENSCNGCAVDKMFFLNALEGVVSYAYDQDGTARTWRTSDGGDTWAFQPFASPGDPFIRVLDYYQVNDTVSFMSGAIDKTLMTEDGGKNWKVHSQSLFNATLNAVDSAGSCLVMVGDKGRVAMIKDGILSTIDSGIRDQLTVVDFGTETKGLTSGPDGNIYYTADQGARWQKVASVGSEIQAIASHGSDRVVGGVNGKIFRSSDHGKTWTDISFTDQSIANFTINSIAIMGEDSIYAGASATKFNGYSFNVYNLILRSFDNGASWKQTMLFEGSGEARPVEFLRALPSGRILAAGGAVMYYSDNKGVTWNSAVVTGQSILIQVQVGEGGAIYGISRSAIFRSLDNGTSWEMIKDLNRLTRYSFVRDFIIMNNEMYLTGADGLILGPDNVSFVPLQENIFGIDIITGVDNELLNTNVLYPNPVTDQIRANLRAFENAPVEVRIQALDGKVIQSFTSDGNSFQFSMAGLTNGIYIIQVIQKTQRRAYRVVKF